MTFEDLIKYAKENINLKDFAEKHYGFEFAQDRGQKNIMASCKLKSHASKDKTPSFAYRPDFNDYVCFGCGDRGNIINFIANMEDLETKGEDFIEILKIICEKENIQYDFSSKKPVDPKITAEIERRTQLAIKYLNNLWENKSGEAFQYLLSRGLTENTIKNFALGLTFANESRFGLNNISNRISFPIRTDNGKCVIGFSYRIINGDDKFKYINNPSDEIFLKKNILYGWSHAFETIKKAKIVYVVEGQMDMISMYQIGIKNTVAMMTSTITEEQMNLIAKYAKTVIFIIDQDKAGENGFNSKLNEMLRLGLDVKVVATLDHMGKDMNDVCQKVEWDISQLTQILISNTVDGMYFKLSKLLQVYDQKRFEMQTSILSIANNIAMNIPDDAKREVLNNYVRKRLAI